MIEKDDIVISRSDHLHLHIIGYPYEGESIVLNIGNKFVGVIDCFKHGNYFKTKEIIEQYGGKLDFLCWTHTDWDHTFGLSDLKQYFYEETAIIVPEGFQAKEWREVLFGGIEKQSYIREEYKKVFDMIDQTKPYLYYGVNESTDIYKFNLVNKSEVIEFSMKSFAPMGKIVHDLGKKYLRGAMKSKQGKQKLFESFNHDNNLFSVGLEINIRVCNELITIILTGDLDNEVIEQMNPKTIERIFSKATIIKIPHHGSSNSNKIIEYKYPNKIMFDYAVTTNYHGILPEIEVLDKYKEFGKVVNVNQVEKEEYGIAEYEIPLLDKQDNLNALHMMHYSGNAKEYL